MTGHAPHEMVSLRELQLAEFSLLRTFSGFCETHRLRYWLTAGTLLGAVRHGGFIPWDDDIDVAMPRKDFNRLEKLALQGGLPEDCVWQSSKSDRNYPFFFAKIRKRDSSLREACNAKIDMRHGLFIDIFPLDVSPRGERTGRLFYKTHEFFSSVLRVKVNPDSRCGYASGFLRGFHHCVEALFPLPLLKALRTGLTGMVHWLCGTSGRLCTLSAAHGYPRETYDADWFADTSFLPFEGKPFPVPTKYRALLAHMYGADWETPLREPDRASHFILDPKGETP